jgi:bifunctional non-homologous end joining protein LigD
MVAGQMLPELANRPLSLLRCPDGVGKECFFQKHIMQNIGAHVQRVRIRENLGTGIYFSVGDATGLLELVQMNALEFHPWGAHADDVEHCDRIVFDLDPDPRLDWKRMIAAARDVRAQLEKIGLESFVRTSGGKGLHVVVPLNPGASWDAAREFSGAFARTMSELKRAEYVATAGEKNRRGRIFIDWLRNGRGATSVASYTLRARPEGGIAMPLSWTQLGRVTSGDEFTIARVLKLLPSHADPWKKIGGIRQKLPKI